MSNLLDKFMVLREDLQRSQVCIDQCGIEGRIQNLEDKVALALYFIELMLKLDERKE